MDLSISGGCDGNKPTILILVVLLIMAIIITWYVYKFAIDAGVLAKRDNMCGGYDQLCGCAGNETMKAEREVNEYSLSKTLAGYN